jgi:hypothetical protein
MNSSEYSAETYATISRTKNFLVSGPNEYAGVAVLSNSDEKSCTFTVVPIQVKVSLRFHKYEKFYWP